MNSPADEAHSPPIPPKSSTVDAIVIFLETKQFKEAEALALETIAREPTNAVAWAARARCQVNASIQSGDLSQVFESARLANKFGSKDNTVTTIQAATAREYARHAAELAKVAEDTLSQYNFLLCLECCRIVCYLTPQIERSVFGIAVRAFNELTAKGVILLVAKMKESLGEELFKKHLSFAVSKEIEMVKATALSIAGTVVWEGWKGLALGDVLSGVVIDGKLLGNVSVVKGFRLPFRATLGVHELALKVPIKSSVKYRLEFKQPGNYIVSVKYSKLWGNWDKQCELRKID
jgi:hypothetical protein